MIGFRRLLATGVLTVTLGVSGAFGQERVTISELDWTGAKGVAYVLKAVIELRLGGKVEIKGGDAAVVFAAMDKGDGGIDVFSDLWMPSQTEKWVEYIEKRKTVVPNAAPYKGIQRLWVPGYVQDQYNVRTIEDLKRPEIVKLFDSDGNGKGEYWPGAPGWNSTNVWQVKFASYGLDKFYEPQILDQRIMLNRLDAAFRKKQPLLFYYYTPQWAHLVYDIRMIEEPKFTGLARPEDKNHPLYNRNGCFTMYQPKDRQDWLEVSKVTCAMPDADVWIAHSKSLATRAPKSAQFLTQVKLTTDMVSTWVMLIGKDKKDAQDVAEAWVKSNKAIVDEWLKGI